MLLVFFLFTRKRLIYKNLVNSGLHKIQSISNLVNEKNLYPSVNLELKKNKNYKNFDLLREKYKKFILVAPCANWIGKTWPIDNFIELLKKFRKNKKFSKSIFIIIGAIDEKKMKKLINNKNINLLDLVGKIDLIEMYYLMQKATYL